MIKRILIIGITGLDYNYLAEFLLEKGYKENEIKRHASSFYTQCVDQIHQNLHADNRNVFLSLATPHYLVFRQALRNAMSSCCDWLGESVQPMRHAGLYRDRIHPTKERNRVQATLFAKQLAFP